mgnify:CR=1 FL=1
MLEAIILTIITAATPLLLAAIGELVPNALKVRVEATLGLDVGMADEISNLGLFAAENAFLAHTILRICKKVVHFTCGKNEALRRKMFSV